MANDPRLFQSTRDEPNWLAALELIDHAEADQVIESYFYGQCAAASLAIVTKTLVVTMPGFKSINIGRSQGDAIHDALRLTHGVTDSGVSQRLGFGQIQRAFVDGAASDGANHAVAANAQQATNVIEIGDTAGGDDGQTGVAR